jgi:hypothetical protein
VLPAILGDLPDLRLALQQPQDGGLQDMQPLNAFIAHFGQHFG